MAMDRASAKREENPKAKIALAVDPEAYPESATQRVVIIPSSPPYTADLMYSPALMCFSWPGWSAECSSSCFTFWSSSPLWRVPWVYAIRKIMIWFNLLSSSDLFYCKKLMIRNYNFKSGVNGWGPHRHRILDWCSLKAQKNRDNINE